MKRRGRSPPSYRTVVNKAYDDLIARRITEAKFNEICDNAEKENERIPTMFKSRQAANRFAGSDSPSEFPQGWKIEAQTKGLRAKNVSPMDIDQNELFNMFEAVKRKQPYRCEITTKSVGGGGFLDSVGTKTPGAPIAEGAPWPTWPVPAGDPARPHPGAAVRDTTGWPTRFPAVEIDAPSIEYLVHTGNTNPAAVVAELGVKPDIGLQLDTQTATPIKLAALGQRVDGGAAGLRLLLQLGAQGVVPRGDQRGDPAARAGDWGQRRASRHDRAGRHARCVDPRLRQRESDVSGIDTLLQAVNDIRVGPVYGHADLIITHPSNWDFLKRTKTGNDAFVLSVMDPTSLGRLDNRSGPRW